jgi:hypothetical protein
MSFAYKGTFTIDHTKVPNTNQSDFPVMISGTFDGTGGIPNLKYVGNSGHVQNANGYDIYFYSDISLSAASRLCVERESYSATSGAVIFWVKVPTLSYTADTVIYIAYGDSSIVTDPNNDGTYGKTSVWTNYNNVYHLNQNAKDSTANANDGTLGGSVLPSALSGGGYQFAGGHGNTPGDYNRIDIGHPSSFNFKYDSEFTLILIFKSSKNDTQNHFVFANADATPYAGRIYCYMPSITGNVNLYFFIVDTNSKVKGTLGNTVVNDNNKHIAAMTYKNNVAANYVDGNIQPATYNDTMTGDFYMASTKVSLGARYDSNLTPKWISDLNGNIYQLINIKTAVTADWLNAFGNNYNSPSTFYAVGQEHATSLFLSISDSISVSETNGSISALIRSFSESLTASDSLSILSTFIKTITDTLNVIDNNVIVSTFFKSFSDSLIASESFISVNSFLFSFAESIVTSDGYNSVSDYIQQFNDLINTSDSFEHVSDFRMLIDDIIAISDDKAFFTSFILNDIVNLTDNEIIYLNMKFIGYLGILGILKAYLGTNEVNLK